ncbi:MAG: hypothetical protein FWG10_09235 [Eubacteriaceae bacterium]|nr:hypothetical protein [Eubacteriaceae bacterium]
MKLNKRIAAILLALLVAITLAAPVFAMTARVYGGFGRGYGNFGRGYDNFGRGYGNFGHGNNYRRGTSYKGNNYKFNKCAPKKTDNPKTADFSNIALWSSMALTSVAGTVFVSMKKRAINK